MIFKNRALARARGEVNLTIFSNLLWRPKKTRKCENSSAGVALGERPGANFQYLSAFVGANSIFTTKPEPEKVFDVTRRQRQGSGFSVTVAQTLQKPSRGEGSERGPVVGGS